MKEEHFVDYPAVPITHAFIEVKKTRIRDRFVRSANMRKYVLEGGTIRTSQAFTAEKRFDKKRTGIRQIRNQQKHWDQLAQFTHGSGKEEHYSLWSTRRQNRKQRIPTVLHTRRCRRCTKSHGQVADKKLVTSTVSSRERGMQRIINQGTTSSQIEKTKSLKSQLATHGIHLSFERLTR